MRITIDRLGHLGDGVGRDETGAPVFAPMTLPGEVVEGEVADARMADPRVLVPSAVRVRAGCPHFGTCGGCSLMHASDAFVADWKTGILRAALAAHDLSAPLRSVHTSPRSSRRRASFAGRRTKSGTLVGFHARASAAIIPIPDCRLVHPQLAALLPTLGRMTAVGASRSATLIFAATVSDTGIDLVVEGGKAMTPELFGMLADLSHDALLARLTWGADVVVTRAPPRQRIAGVDVVPPAGAFLQATAAGEHALQSAVADALAQARSVADLFAGCGTLALAAARRAAVHAVEGDAAMLAALADAVRGARGLRPVTTELRDLFRRPLLPDELARFDAAVVDPPRSGAEAQVTEIARSALTRLAMVSCNPVTFARDARILCDAGFRIGWVDVIDQFRWSPHVELAAEFTR